MKVDLWERYRTVIMLITCSSIVIGAVWGAATRTVDFQSRITLMEQHFIVLDDQVDKLTESANERKAMLVVITNDISYIRRDLTEMTAVLKQLQRSRDGSR